MQRPQPARATAGSDLPDALVPGSRSPVNMGSTWEGGDLSSGYQVFPGGLQLCIYVSMHLHLSV